MANYKKQRHGHLNPIMQQEEIALLAAIDRTLRSTSNSQILGRNGEQGLVTFLNRYLPSCFRTGSGHFVTPDGTLSPEIDVLVLDARYPLLSENADGSVIAMLHAVLATIEVKLRLLKKEIGKMRATEAAVRQLCTSLFPGYGWSGVLQMALAYRTGTTLATVKKHFFADWHRGDPVSSLQILRVHDSDQLTEEGPLGAVLWLEGGNHPAMHTSLAPLSDFYYQLVQDCYSTLSARDYDFAAIAEHMMQYMKWGTFPCTNRGA